MSDTFAQLDRQADVNQMTMETLHPWSSLYATDLDYCAWLKRRMAVAFATTLSSQTEL